MCKISECFFHTLSYGVLTHTLGTTLENVLLHQLSSPFKVHKVFKDFNFIF